MHLELGLQRLQIFLAIRTVTTGLRFEGYRRAVCAVSLDRDASQPLRDAQNWFLHFSPAFKRIADQVPGVSLFTSKQSQLCTGACRSGTKGPEPWVRSCLVDCMPGACVPLVMLDLASSSNRIQLTKVEYKQMNGLWVPVQDEKACSNLLRFCPS